MAVSGIVQVNAEGHALSLTTFLRGVVPYVAWTTGVEGSARLWFRTLGGADGSETFARLAVAMNRVAVAARADGNLVVVYDDSTAPLPRLWRAVLDMAGNVLLPPAQIATGSAPTLTVLEEAAAGRHTLVYANKPRRCAYIRESYDDGVTWGDERPILNNRVRDGAAVVAVPFSTKHLSIIQIGTDAKQIVELGSFTRTRPLVGLAQVDDDRIVAVEAATRGAYLADTLRGNVVVDESGRILAPTRTRIGVDDGVAEVMLLDTTGNAPALVSSAGTPAGANPGAEVATILPYVSGSDVLTPSEVLPTGAVGVLAQIATAEGHCYGAAYREDVTDGSLVALRLSDGQANVVATGLHFHGVAALRGPGATSAETVLVTCRMIGAQNYLSVGKLGADPLAPEWLIGDHALPARADALTLALTAREEGTVYAALHDRICIYRLAGLAQPVRLQSTILCLTLGRVMHMTVAPNGNLVCAMGEGGVAVFTPAGETISHLVPSGLYADYWRPGKAYSAGDHVVPTKGAGFAGQRKWFRCTVPGTSGGNEPRWEPSGAIFDAGCTWVDDGPLAAVVTAVALDASRKRIYATAVLGGPAGTVGRVYAFSAQGLI